MKTDRDCEGIKIADVLPCPVCRANLTDIRATTDGRLPEADDVTICEYCATVLVFAAAGGALTLQLAPPDVVADPDVAAAAVVVAGRLHFQLELARHGLRPLAQGPCPFCGANVIVGIDARRNPSMLHKDPMCRSFNEMGVVEILQALNAAHEARQRQVH